MRLHLLALVAALLLPSATLKAAPLDPTQFDPLSAFQPVADVEIDTSSTPPTLTEAGQAPIEGVIVSVTGAPEIAVFAFESVQIDAEITVQVRGTRAIAILSHGDFVLSGTLDANAVSAVAGPGGYDGATQNGSAGSGPGGGKVSSTPPKFGGGAGHGGPGGRSGYLYVLDGGDVYGDLRLLLQGGSGGGRALYTTDPSGVGGGGGGAVEIGAAGLLEIEATGAIHADGAAGENKSGTPAPSGYGAEGGGGGSGGGILVHGASGVLRGALSAKGGKGGNAPTCGFAGGGGGGGRIVLVDIEIDDSSVLDLEGGAGGLEGASCYSNHGLPGGAGVLLAVSRPLQPQVSVSHGAGQPIEHHGEIRVSSGTTFADLGLRFHGTLEDWPEALVLGVDIDDPTNLLQGIASGEWTMGPVVSKELEATPQVGRLLGRGSLTLTTDVESAGGGSTDHVFTIHVDLPATRLALATQPGGGVAGAAWLQAPVVYALEPTGELPDPFYDGLAVAAEIASGPAGATLSGATSVVADEGVISFSDLRIGTPGTYTLRFSGKYVTEVLSEPFVVEPEGEDGPDGTGGASGEDGPDGSGGLGEDIEHGEADGLGDSGGGSDKAGGGCHFAQGTRSGAMPWLVLACGLYVSLRRWGRPASEGGR